jgi:DNA-binding transcriptional regulator YdaS (Cro superfamily)
MQHEELIKAIRMIGSQQKLAKELGIRRSVINNWLNRGTTVSLEHALNIEMLTEGNVKAETLVPNAKVHIVNFKKYLLHNMQ